MSRKWFNPPSKHPQHSGRFIKVYFFQTVNRIIIRKLSTSIFTAKFGVCDNLEEELANFSCKEPASKF